MKGRRTKRTKEMEKALGKGSVVTTDGHTLHIKTPDAATNLQVRHAIIGRNQPHVE